MKQVFAAILLFSFFTTSCGRVLGKRVKGSGNIRTEIRNLSGFSNVKVSSSIDVYLSQDSAWSVKVETDDNLIQHIETYVEGDILYIDIEKNYNPKPTDALKVHVSAPLFQKLTASGACDVQSTGRLTSNGEFGIKLTGASDAKLDLKAPKVTADLTGAGSLALQGETKDLQLKGTGSSEMECFGMMAENVSVKITGAGDADVFASISLDVNVTGSGSVKYKGSPSVNQKISGAGSVKKVN
jgi:hypothetical protein